MGVTAGTCPEGRPVPSTRAAELRLLLSSSTAAPGCSGARPRLVRPGRIDWRVDGLTGSHRIDWCSWPRARSACRPPCERAASRQPRPVRARPSRRPGCRHATRRNRQSPTRLDPSGRPNRRGTTRRPLAAVPGRSSSTWAPVTTACRPGGRCEALAAPHAARDLGEGNCSGREARTAGEAEIASANSFAIRTPAACPPGRPACRLPAPDRALKPGAPERAAAQFAALTAESTTCEMRLHAALVRYQTH